MSREKEAIENQLEAEQEYIVNKLQKQAMGLAAEKQALQGEKADLKRQVGPELTRGFRMLESLLHSLRARRGLPACSGIKAVLACARRWTSCRMQLQS